MSRQPESNTTDQAAQDARQHADALASKASDQATRVASTAKDVGKRRAEQGFERGKQVAEGHVDAAQSAVGEAARQLEEEDHPFASYATELSGQLSSLSQRIESSSLDELVRDGRSVASSNPGLFMLGAVAVGFAAARFIKASERHDEDDYVRMDSFDEDEDEDEVHERYMAGAGASDTSYRRVAAPPVTPAPRTSTSAAPAGVGAAAQAPAIARPAPTKI